MSKHILFIDFETRSEADLLIVGAHRYCMDKTTEVIAVSYAFDKEPEKVCTWDDVPEEVHNAIEDDNVLKIAHNAEFDMCVCAYILGFSLTFSSWFDTAYQASYYGFPRSLKNLSKVLGTTQKASQEELMFFSKPVALAKEAPKDELFASPTPTKWNEGKDYPEMWDAFMSYTKGDTAVMRECFNKMVFLPDIEVFTMQITFEMNFNGVPFDTELANKILTMSNDYAQRAGVEALEKYGIKNLRSTQQVKNALLAEGVLMNSLNKKEREGQEHEILFLRDQATGSAFSKIPTAFLRLCPDGRLHGELVGHGAHTGRWSSRGVQLQNWARIKDIVNELLVNVKDYDHLRQHMRLCLGFQKGKDFSCGDLKQIEARIVAWLANCKWRMEAFANDIDIYARSAEKMFGLEHVSKDDEERQDGKASELSLGYGGGENAILRINPDFYRKRGSAKVKQLVYDWREANQEIVSLWHKLERAFREALKTGASMLKCGGAILKFQFDGKTARIILPSGRALYYKGVHQEQNDWKTDLYYMDYSRGNGDPQRVKFWGGTLLENITQAIARDVIVDIMLRIKKRVPESTLIGTVHDEIWYLDIPELKMLDVMLEEMARPITWAVGLITKGDGFTSDRYRK